MGPSLPQKHLIISCPDRPRTRGGPAGCGVTFLPCSAKLQAAVVLNPGYSALPPIFSLCLNWKGERTGNNDDNIRVSRGRGGGTGELLGVFLVVLRPWGGSPGGRLGGWEQQDTELRPCCSLRLCQAMESEVNVCYKELWGPKPGYQLLTNQLQRLCMVLDVYLETEPHDTSVEGPKEFPQEKMCLRLVR